MRCWEAVLGATAACDRTDAEWLEEWIAGMVGCSIGMAGAGTSDPA